MGDRNNTILLIIIFVAILGLLWYLNRNGAISNEGEMYVPEQEDEIEHLNENNAVTENTSTQLLDGNYMNPELLEHLTESGVKGPGLVGNAMPGSGVFTSNATVSASSVLPNINDDLASAAFDPNSNMLAGVTNDDIDQIINERSKKQLEFNNADLLPNEVNKDWFESDFSNARIKIGNDNLINTDRYMIGVNTVGQSLKNPSYDLRPSPPCPKVTVSPWNQSTIEPDFNIKSWY
jgi:hypothetical protein